MVTAPRVASRVPARKTRYPVTPTLSVDAVQDRLICEEEAAEAENPVGVDGAVVSTTGGTIAVFKRTAALWPLKEIELTIGMESSTDSRLSCVSCRLACGRVTDATLPVGLTYT